MRKGPEQTIHQRINISDKQIFNVFAKLKARYHPLNQQTFKKKKIYGSIYVKCPE